MIGSALLHVLVLAGVLGEAPPESTTVYQEHTGGYFAYRIPAIECAPDGSLLAFAEARKHNLGDPGQPGQDIDLVLRRSTDGGRSWSAMTVIEDPGELWSAANPATVVDRDTKRVWVLYLRCQPGRGSEGARPGTDDARVLARTSDDNGQTWSEPVDLTRATRDFADPSWRISVMGPGGMIQDRRGRLVAAFWMYEPFRNFAVFSDDHGQTWKRGGFVAGSGDECQVVERSDGQLLMDMRQSKGPRREFAQSADGGLTWTPRREGLPASPVCCAIERYPVGPDRARLLWTGPRGPGRKDLVLRISDDDGQSFPVERLIAAGPAAYSDLAVLKDGSVGVLWESGTERGYQAITFTRLTPEFLSRGSQP